MRWPTAAALVALLLAFASLLTERIPPRQTHREVARVQAHLAGAEAFARTRDLSGLTAPQRAARARHLERFAVYRERGVFPLNDVVPGRSPVFVDARGVHCAVGHLLALDGEGELVARIAATRNLARIREMADEPELIAWLDRNGLTVEEAARIQPAYDYGDDTPDEESGHRTFAAVMTGFAATGVLVNLKRGDTPAGRDIRSFYGLLVGATSIGAGILALTGEDAEVLATAAVLTGGASVAMSFRNRGGPKEGFGIEVGPTLERRGVAFVRASF